jgi:hypothetical protein
MAARTVADERQKEVEACEAKIGEGDFQLMLPSLAFQLTHQNGAGGGGGGGDKGRLRTTMVAIWCGRGELLSRSCTGCRT